jgi:diadenosine tetraphosphate (Ap4A) HIT family hydrolase
MTVPELTLTEADLARIVLSGQLRTLSESLRLAVAAEDHDGDLAARLWSLTTTEIPLLRQAIASYVRARGGSWRDITELGGPTEDEARERCAGIDRSHLPDPSAEIEALDTWYVRHAHLEPAGRVRDPFSRLLSGRVPGAPTCLICGKYAGNPMPAWAGFPVPPGGHLVDDCTWRVGHGPTSYWPVGTLLIESRRHFRDYADFEPREAATLGPLIKRLIGPLREATGAPRIHVFSSMEGTEHFHLWLVPRAEGRPAGRAFLAEPGHCSPVEAEEMIGRIRLAMTAALAG